LFIRIVQPQIRPGKARAAATRWQEFAGPLMRQNPHLRHGYMAVNGDRTSMVVVTFWDLIPGAEANSLF
jgi:hypothetical protein